MIAKRLTKQRGVSLIEVLFAIFIAAASAVILATAMPIANSSRARADLNNKATSLSQKMLEAVRGVGYPNATPLLLYSNGLIDSPVPEFGKPNTYSCTNVDTAKFDNAARVLPQGKGYVTVEQVDIDLKRVIVEVTWMDRGRTKSIEVGTLLANL